MKRRNIGWLWLWAMLVGGCYEEGELAATEQPEAIYGKYTLPQGQHDYDAEIVEMYEKYNTLILYRFEEKDFWWAMTRDIRWRYDSVQDRRYAGYEAVPADERYVGEQLDLVKEKFLKYFPDTLLARTLPLKLLFTGYLNFVVSGTGLPTAEHRERRNVYWGFDYIGINWGNEQVLTMTAEERNAFKVDICTLFLQQSARNTMERDPLFFAVSTYTSGGNQSTPANGFIDENVRDSQEADWDSYIAAIVSTPYERMIAEGGILHPDVDTKGKIREKYERMLTFFQETYHINLQAIGDDVEESPSTGSEE